MTPTPADEPLFLRACRGGPVLRPPVWMMRQAGRYLPEYRAVRRRADFLTLCRTPELAAEVTLQPVDILGVDAAVVFSDILVVLEAAGIPVHFEEGGGPVLQKRIRSAADMVILRTFEPESLAYVGGAIRAADAVLRPRGVPVIGFAGAPFTLAAYAVEGKTSRDFPATRRFMREAPDAFSRLLDYLASAVAAHLAAQIQAGARAVQIFETWGGLLARDVFASLALPAIQTVIQRLKPLGAPVILYLNGSAPHLEAMARSGADVLSVDWRLPLSECRRRAGPAAALQGNLDPAALYGCPASVREAAAAMLRDFSGPGLVANLGHGIFPDTPVENARAFIETVQSWPPR